MTYTIIIVFCALLLVAYVFNLTSSKTKIPSVILLLLMGLGLKEVTYILGYRLPDFHLVLPVLATIGLVLIVLEGSLELSLNQSKLGLIKKASLGALVPMVALAFLLSYMFQYVGGYSLRDSLINAIPLCVISSAIAIPSISNLNKFNREFVIYESSLSDMLGVLFFNFMSVNQIVNYDAFEHFGLQLLFIMVISVVATFSLSWLLSRIEHHVKFVPIILLVILIFAISEIYHLPALIFILIFGLSIGNLDELKRFKWVQRFKTENLNHEIQRFKELTVEGAFLVRSLFFMLFGYSLEISEILNTDTLVWSIGIVVAIFLFRAVQLKFSNLDITPLLFIAPRGLITILLFLAISPSDAIFLVNKSLIIQVVVLSTLVMTLGLMFTKKEDHHNENEIKEEKKRGEEAVLETE